MSKTPENYPASPTVYGLEVEYSVMIEYPDDKTFEIVGACHASDSQLGLYEEPNMHGMTRIHDDDIDIALDSMGISRVSSSGLLSNGGRFYIDPSGPEYATPETSTAEEAVHRSFDGDEIVLGIFRHFMKNEIIDSFQLNRRIIDHNRVSRGVHLNNSTTLPSDLKYDIDIISKLATLNTIKGAIFGSGGLLLDHSGNTAFHHSPRLSVTNKVSEHYVSHTERPLVRTPFKSDFDNLSRVETVTSDALNFAWPLRASLVTTNVLLKILELKKDAKIPVLKDPISAAKIVGRYGNEHPIQVSFDSEYLSLRPLDLMKLFCELSLVENQKDPFLDEESSQVLQEIIEVSDKIKNDPESTIDQVESVARYDLMKKKMDKVGCNIDSEIMCRFDYAWDILGRDGIAEKFRQKNLSGWQGFSQKYSPAARKRRMITPPEDTRAKARGQAIYEKRQSDYSDWETIDILDQKTGDYRQKIFHPLDNGDEVNMYKN